MKYELYKSVGRARLGRIIFKNCIINTPTFMPVGTYGVLRTLCTEDFQNLDIHIILSNTLHILLKFGFNIYDLHNFMRWKKLILTDSGGFQLFSLNKFIKVCEEGVYFNFLKNGKKFLLTPELVIKFQNYLNSDIHMILDECISLKYSKFDFEKSVELSLRWAYRSKICFNKYNNFNSLFGIIQGGMYSELREKSLNGLLKIGFHGYALGGLAVGESKKKCLIF